MGTASLLGLVVACFCLYKSRFFFTISFLIEIRNVLLRNAQRETRVGGLWRRLCHPNRRWPTGTTPETTLGARATNPVRRPWTGTAPSGVPPTSCRAWVYYITINLGTRKVVMVMNNKSLGARRLLGRPARRHLPLRNFRITPRPPSLADEDAGQPAGN